MSELSKNKAAYFTPQFCPDPNIGVSLPSSSSHRQGQDAVVVLNYKQQACNLAARYRITMILRAMSKDPARVAPLLPGKEGSGPAPSMRA